MITIMDVVVNYCFANIVLVVRGVGSVHPTALDTTHLGQDMAEVADAKEIGSLKKEQQEKKGQSMTTGI